MRDYLQSTIQFPMWASSRYVRLDFLDRILDGELYDYLPYEFYQEADGQNNYIQMHQRKPSVRFNVAYKMANDVSRKMFAGRHKPHFVHVDDSLRDAISALQLECRLDLHMLRAVEWGTIGSVAVVFRFSRPDIGQDWKLFVDVWRSKWCTPYLDSFNELRMLRLQFCTPGTEILALHDPQMRVDNKGEEIQEGNLYFFTRDYTPEAEVTYAPVREAGRVPDPEDLTPREVFEHNFGFVPATWITTARPGFPPDGGCLWWHGVHNMIEEDYAMSQTGRGVKYNVAPQLVLKGDIKNYRFKPSTGEIEILARDPSNAIHLEGDRKDTDGTTMTGGDAFLLETNGQGIKVAVEDYANSIRKRNLEQLSMSRKDPDKLNVLQSGKAMEQLDEETVDLISEQRTSFGEYGYLPLIRKIVRAAKMVGHPSVRSVSVAGLDAAGLQWPRLFQPGAQEFLQFVQGLQALRGGSVPGAGGDSSAPVPLAPLITDDEARALLEVFIDIPPDVKPTNRPEPVPQLTPEGSTPAAV